MINARTQITLTGLVTFGSDAARESRRLIQDAGSGGD